MQSLGFSNVIVSNSVFNKDIISYEMQLMQEYGFRRMIFALNHDVTSDTVSQYIEKRNEISKLINSSAPRASHPQTLSANHFDVQLIHRVGFQRGAVKAVSPFHGHACRRCDGQHGGRTARLENHVHDARSG